MLKDKEHAAALAYGVKRPKKIRKETPNGVRHAHLAAQLHHYQTQQDEGTTPPSSESMGDVKCERLSPETGHNNDTQQNSTSTHGTSPSPSASPKSPASHRTRTPSFPGTPPNPAFTPPTSIHPGYDRFSPAALSGMTGLPGSTGAIKQMESFMNRNCSELMRSLAARYNNSNPNE